MVNLINIQPVILCGGYGVRLWPASREKLPKQFLEIFDGKSLFQLTLERVNSLKNAKTPIIITNHKYKFLVSDIIEKLHMKAQIILEPESKNTTAAIYFAARFSSINDFILILPSDHIMGQKGFAESIVEPLKDLPKESWMVYGVHPTYPSVDYGYIEIKKEHDFQNKVLKVVSSFKEKPDFETAAKMLLEGNFFWNSGMFLAKAKYIIKSIKFHAGEIENICKKIFEDVSKFRDNNSLNLDHKLYKTIPSLSIDYAVLEKDKNIVCKPLNILWSDVGSWDTVMKFLNTSQDNKKIIQIEGRNKIISFDDRIITTVGINDLIVIDTKDATLITRKDKSYYLREAVNEIRKNNMKFAENHFYEKRPWGRFDVLTDTHNFKVKKLTVLPKKRLSLQYHLMRSEHWLVVSGLATVYVDGKEIKLQKGNSIDVKQGVHHYISNEENEELVIVEIQMGTYFGEDDIIRIEDPYARKEC